MQLTKPAPPAGHGEAGPGVAESGAAGAVQVAFGTRSCAAAIAKYAGALWLEVALCCGYRVPPGDRRPRFFQESSQCRE